MARRQFEQEVAFYNKSQSSWSQHNGKWAVICNETAIAFEDSEEKAIKRGKHALETHSRLTYLIQQLGEEPPSFEILTITCLTQQNDLRPYCGVAFDVQTMR